MGDFVFSFLGKEKPNYGKNLEQIPSSPDKTSWIEMLLY